MAQRAIIQLPVARKTRGVENMLSLFLFRMSRLISDVLGAVAMTFCAVDAQLVIVRISRLAAGQIEFKRRAVAFQASRRNDAFKIDLAVHIAGAVDPLLDSSQERNRQLEQES